jgi:hypothetical protein
MAANNTGIGSIPTNAQRYIDTLDAIRANKDIFDPDMAAVAKREAELAKYLGATDYAKQLTDAQSLSKLQLALALAQRGFAAAGATPVSGETPVSTLSRELLSPLAGDAGAVATQMMQQKQALNAAQRQEERQLKLAALQDVQTRAAARRDVALKLTPDPKTTKLLADPFVVVSRDEDGDLSLVTKEDDPAAIQVRQQSGSPAVVDIKTGVVHTLLPGQEIMKLSEYSKNKGTAGKVANVGYMQNNASGKYIHVSRQGPNLPAIDSLTGAEITDPKNWTWVGSTIPKTTGTDKPTVVDMGLAREWIEDPDDPTKLILGPLEETKGMLINGVLRQVVPSPDGTKNVPIKMGNLKGEYQLYEKPTGGGETEAERSTEANRKLLLNSMNWIQTGRLEGANTPYSARSALWFDQAAFSRGKQPFKYLPPETPPLEAASRAVTITDKNVLNLIESTWKSLADTTLKQNFGEQSPVTKMGRLREAAKRILSLTPETLFGAFPIEVIGELNGKKVGYTPGAAAYEPAIQRQKTKQAVAGLKGDPTLSPLTAYAPVALPRSEEGFNQNTGRVNVATRLFRDAFGEPQIPGDVVAEDGSVTNTYDAGLAQRRRDIEAVLSNVRLLPNASSEDHRAVISEAAEKKAEKRKKIQNSPSAVAAREAYDLGLEFRDALINFKNAAAKTNVEGFVTGKVASVLATVGLEEWIAGDGAEHWRRLSIASERFQQGISRRVGRDFGDNRISNYDAEAYKKLVPAIEKGEKYNKILVKQGLNRVNSDLTDLMAQGGRVAWTERDLVRAAEAGVDFSQLKTREDWHGYGFYGKDRYYTTRQPVRALSPNQQSSLTTKGQLKDTMYGGQYTVPIVAAYLTGKDPMFTLGQKKTSNQDAVAATPTQRMGPIQFKGYLEKLAAAANVDIEEIRRRVVRSIVKYNIWRDNLK